MANEGRVLHIIRDGRRYQGLQLLQLPFGAQGNRETVRIMSQIVREDALQPDLKRFALEVCIGLENSTLTDQIDAAYRFARDGIAYQDEGEGTETVADLWSSMYSIGDHAAGDCAIKSVALATLLCYLKLRPSFACIRQVPNVDWFDHVYVLLMDGDKETVLDPTPPEFRPGDALPYYEREIFPIFA